MRRPTWEAMYASTSSRQLCPTARERDFAAEAGKSGAAFRMACCNRPFARPARKTGETSGLALRSTASTTAASAAGSSRPHPPYCGISIRLGNLFAVRVFEVGMEGALLGTPAHQHGFQFRRCSSLTLILCGLPRARSMTQTYPAGSGSLPVSLVLDAEADRVALDRRLLQRLAAVNLNRVLGHSCRPTAEARRARAAASVRLARLRLRRCGRGSDALLVADGDSFEAVAGRLPVAAAAAVSATHRRARS